MSSLDELFPDLAAREEWITARADRFVVTTMARVEPDHPLIAMSIEAVDEEGEFTREAADARVAELEAAGIPAWTSPARQEWERLSPLWEASRASPNRRDDR